MSVLSRLYYGNEFAGLVQPAWTKTPWTFETGEPPMPAPIPPEPKSVYDCIVAVSAALAAEGVSKTRKNEQQGYRFRGIDDVFNALAPLLAKYRLVILPRVLDRTVVERTTKSGGVLFYVTVAVEFVFVSAADGSQHTVLTYGEAMDSADKATNKAQSAAYKYAALQTFCIPTEGDNDADAVTHEPVIQLRDAAPPPAPPSHVDTTTGEELPPGFALIDEVKQDGDFTHISWGRDAKGGWRVYKTKLPTIAQHARAAFLDRAAVRLHGKKFPYVDRVERLDGELAEAGQ